MIYVINIESLRLIYNNRAKSCKIFINGKYSGKRINFPSDFTCEKFSDYVAQHRDKIVEKYLNS